jgi:hypothetical protein
VSTSERPALLDRYRAGAAEVDDALAGLDEADLDVRPSADAWTVREVVHHLGDAEMRSSIRLRQLIAEDDAKIQGYDERAYTERLHYDRPLGSALDAMRAARAINISLLESLTPDEWSRRGVHSDSGAYSVDDWLRIYAAHPHEHADQIREVRSAILR